jgi:SHS2 domain-containing protein
MAKFNFLEHTADVKYRAYGKTLEEAFENAAIAVATIITQDRIKAVKTKKIRIKAKTKRALLYDFIEKIVALMDTDNFLISEVKLKINGKEGAYSLEAVLKGDNCKNYECHGAIKSMTYSEIKIKEGKNKVTLTIVLDI